MAQAQADADFGIAGAIAGATAGKAGAAAGSINSAAVSKAAGDLTRALNAVQTGFVDAATAAGVKATKTIAAAETVERKREKVPATKSGRVRRSAGSRNRHGMVTGLAAVIS